MLVFDDTLTLVVPPDLSQAASANSKLSTYTNDALGISLRYSTKEYGVLKGKEIPKEWVNREPIETKFAQPGGVMIAALVPAGGLGNDGPDELLILSINSKVTAAECDKFSSDDEWTAHRKERVGAMEFAQADGGEGGMCKDIFLKNYHIFRNQACYEIEMGVFASPCLQDKDNDVFGSIKSEFRDLKAILATLAIRPTTVDPIRHKTN